jgi:hypothetical protein
MKRPLAATLTALLVTPAIPSAHRLDEYLQAARVSLSRDRVTLEVDLTPGANIASSIVPLLDRDGDRTITPLEAGAYGQEILADLVVEFDGRPVLLTLARVEAASIDEMREGVGAVRLRAAGSVDPVAAGRRRLLFRNNHHPAGSVYLANALVPDDEGIGVAAQTRDPLQREVRVDYDVAPQRSVRLLWLLRGLAVMLLLIGARAGLSPRHPPATSRPALP